MSHALVMKAAGDTLHVRVRGARTRQIVETIAGEILAACIEQNARKLLVDVREMEGRMSIGDAYDLPAVEFAKLWPAGGVVKAAVVDLEEFEDIYRFFENVARNRGYDLRIFCDPAEAVDWLGEEEETEE